MAMGPALSGPAGALVLLELAAWSSRRRTSPRRVNEVRGSLSWPSPCVHKSMMKSDQHRKLGRGVFVTLVCLLGVYLLGRYFADPRERTGPGAPLGTSSSPDGSGPGVSPVAHADLSSGERMPVASGGPFEPDADRLVDVLVEDDWEVPLPDVDILLVGGLIRARTGSDGRAALPIGNASERYETWEFRSPGFVTRRVEIDTSSDERVVRLRKGVSIRGRVVGTHGGELNRSVHVFLWLSADGLPRLEVIQQLLTDDSLSRVGEVRHVETGLDGTFAFEGLLPGARHSLFAGCLGLLTTGFYSLMDPTLDEEIVLVANGAFGSLIRFEGSGGQPLELPESTRRSRFFYMGTDSDAGTPSHLSDLGAFVAGVPLDLLDHPEKGYLCLFSGPNDAGSVRDCWLTGSFPGYQEVDLRFEATRVEAGITEVVVRLVEITNNFGRLRLVPGDVPPAVLALNKFFKKVIVQMDDTSSSRSDSFAIDFDLKQGGQIEQVAEGSYRTRVLTKDKLWSDPAASVDPVVIEIRPGEETTVPVDMSRCGAVVFRLRDSRGSDYEAYFTIACTRGWPTLLPDGRMELRGGSAISLEEPPYVVPALSPGPYTFRGFQPRWGEPAERGYLTVDVEAAQVLEVEVKVE